MGSLLFLSDANAAKESGGQVNALLALYDSYEIPLLQYKLRLCGNLGYRSKKWFWEPLYTSLTQRKFIFL